MPQTHFPSEINRIIIDADEAKSTVIVRWWACYKPDQEGEMKFPTILAAVQWIALQEGAEA